MITATAERIEVAIEGSVQGVGFRPFIYRLAADFGLSGWVTNTPDGVLLEAEGESASLLAFLVRIQDDKPAHAAIRTLRTRPLPPHEKPSEGFQILPSASRGAPTAEILPDVATCPACLHEIMDPSDRRFGYPFTNCTHCGPRFTIIEALPYDRRNTTMRAFTLCPRCRAEYDDPLDRRFHAQPTACPDCGPHLAFWSRNGEPTARREEALRAAADLVRSGGIVAVKGIGGFHLLADARDARVIRGLRTRKGRQAKPFAVMFPDIASVRSSCALSPAEEALVVSAAAPIVLLARTGASTVCAETAPGNPTIGALLPYSPLHHLLLRDLGFPVVATSGNLSEDPICIDERDALHRLAGIADAFLVHDRPIRRPCDDSVARVVSDGVILLRRARGFAPRPVRLGSAPLRPILAVGAHQKSAVALLVGANAVISQHLGDLATRQSLEAFEQAVGSLRELYPGTVPEIACDLHPGYFSTQFARDQGGRVRPVQHHYAHVASCMAEHGLEGEILGVAWDGTGFGTDGTSWGGEFLVTGGGGFRRAATFRTFPLPGGDSASREPRRAAIGLLFEMLGDAAFTRTEIASVAAFTDAERGLLRQAVARPSLAPRTSSVGRLFDAVASILGIAQRTSFEGEAAMALEHAAAGDGTPYPFTIAPPDADGCMVVDWEPMIREILADPGVPASAVSGRFHATLTAIIAGIAERTHQERVALSGGCFQNALLLGRTVHALRRLGARPYWQAQVPPNDGGIALGQLYACLLEDHAALGS
jgi:hydrogenase maturation protein HypF